MIADRVAEFVAEKKRRKAAPTYEQYRVVLETIFLPWCANERIIDCSEVTDKVMDRFVDELGTRTYSKAGKALSVATIRTYVRTVRIFLNWCGVPKGRFEMPRQPRRVVNTLTRQEIDLLERVADNERDRLIVRVLADTGVRISELLGLARGDLHANTYERKYLIQVIGKGDKEREVTIPKETYVRLEKLVMRQGGGFVFQRLGYKGGVCEHCGKSYIEKHTCRKGNVVLFGEAIANSKRLDKWAVEKLVHALTKKAGMGARRVTPHLFRHSYATQQLKSMKKTGASLIDIQRQCGWSSLAMLTQIYAHTQPADSYDQLMAGLK